MITVGKLKKVIGHYFKIKFIKPNQKSTLIFLVYQKCNLMFKLLDLL